jgi:hypothetical protein
MGCRAGYLGEQAAVTGAQWFCDSTSCAHCETAGAGDALSYGVDGCAIGVGRLGAALAVELVVAESAVGRCATVHLAFVPATGAEGAGVPLCGAWDTSTLLPDTGHLGAHRVVCAREREHNVGNRKMYAGRRWSLGKGRDRRGWDVATGNERALYLALEATERVREAHTACSLSSDTYAKGGWKS